MPIFHGERCLVVVCRNDTIHTSLIVIVVTHSTAHLPFILEGSPKPEPGDRGPWRGSIETYRYAGLVIVAAIK